MPTMTIDTMYLNLESPNMPAVNIIHGFLPFVASLFFLVSAVVLALCRRPGPVRQKPPRAIIAWPMFFVLVTYAIDTSMLIYLAFQGKVTGKVAVFLDNAFFSFASTFSWIVLLSEFIFYCNCQTSLFPLGGYTALYLTTETLLFAFRPRPAASLDIFDITQLVRLGILLLLLSIVAISRTSRDRPRCVDEEDVPLLQDTCNRPHYGSTARNEYLDPRSQKNQSLIEYSIPRVKRLIPLVWPKSRPYMLYLGIVFFLLLDRFLVVLCPLQIGRITNILANNGKFSWTEIIMTISVTVLASSKVSSVTQSYLWTSIEERSDLELKRAVSDKALNVPTTLGERVNTSNLEKLISRGKSIQTVFGSILFAIIPMSTDILLGVVVTYYMFGAYMAMTPTLVVVTSLWSFTDFHNFLKRNRQQIVVCSAREQLISQDSGFIWQTASYLGPMPHQSTARYSANTKHTTISSHYFSLICLDTALKSFLVMLGLIGGCMLVAIQVFMKLETVGSFITLLMYFTRLGSNLRHIENGVRVAVLELTDTNYVHGLFDWTPDWTPNTSGPSPLRIEQGTIKFNNVHFAYKDQKKVLKGFNFEVPGNTTVALVGATGSGKTTALDLLLGLYSPLQGSITIDGQNPHHSATESFLRNIGFVSQNPLLFHDTVLNNMLCGNPFASEEEIYGACKAVALHERLNSLPRGYQTVLGEAGSQLSSGELQRLALAREVVKNPKIILLDEATSNVDSNTEALIQRNLREFFKDKTIVVVANRLSTVAKADKIIVLRHGRVCEQGSHTSLLKAKGYYHRLWSRQSKTKIPKTEKRQKHEVQEMPDLIDVNDTRPGADAGILGGHSKSTLKPDAPEFVPTTQRVRATENSPKQEDDRVHLHYNQVEDNETLQDMLDASNNDRTQEPVEQKKGSKRKHSRRASSVLRQINNGVVMAYPKKARKTTESNKQSLRRRLTESEPFGTSLLGHP